MKINIGSNTQGFEGFLNIDHRNVEGVDIVDDAFLLESIADRSIDAIIASHILEHASFDRTHGILTRWIEVMKIGAPIWIAVPNFELVYTEHLNNYKQGKIDWEYFNSRIFGNAKVAKQMYSGEKRVTDFDGTYLYELAYHKAVFTPEMLVGCMELAGLVNVKLIDQIPNKKRHPHEICAIGFKK